MTEEVLMARRDEITAEVATHEAAADPHPQYQKESEKGMANGYASLDAGGTVPDGQIPAGIARDSEVAASYQPLDAELTAIAGLTPTDSNFIVGNGTTWVAESGATARTSLGLGDAATYNIGTSGATVPLLSSVDNTFHKSISVRETDVSSGGNGDATLRLQREDSPPVSTGLVSSVYSYAHDSTGSSVVYGGVHVSIISNAAGAQSGRLQLATAASGSYAGRGYFASGMVVGNPTGADKGIGTINAQAVYDDNVLLTCYVLEAELTGQVALTKWNGYTLDLELPEEPEQVEERPVTQKVMRRQRVREGDRVVERQVLVDEPVYDELLVVYESGKPALHGGTPAVERVQRTERVVTRPAQPARTEVRTHEPARRFADRAAELLDPAQYAAAWKANGHLPSMPSPEEWEAAGKKMGIGNMVQRLWETVEVQAVHIEKLRARIEALESSRGTP